MLRKVLLGLPLAALGFWSTYAPAQLSLFSYQGRLMQNTQPVSGEYDFQFRLCDSSFDGGAISPAVVIAPVAVKEGTFHVSLDFGSAVWDGSPRWLEVAVRTYGNTGPYTVLSPRQRLTATPYAAFAATATLAGTLTGGGSSLTNISGTQIRPGSITSS